MAGNDDKLTRMWREVYRKIEALADERVERKIGRVIVGGKVSGGRLSGPIPASSLPDHAERHSAGGDDSLAAESLGTNEIDTTQVLRPDGSGGVAWGAGPSNGGGNGGGGFPITSFTMLDSSENVWTIQIGTDGALTSASGDPNGAMTSFTMIDDNNNEWAMTIGTDGALISIPV